MTDEVGAEKPLAQHPAKFSTDVLQAIRVWLINHPVPDGKYQLLDPFAGIGRVHELASSEIETTGIEIEPEWAEQHPNNIVGDSRNIPFNDGYFDLVVTSPAYANRMADHYEAKDNSKRITYRHMLGRALTEGNSGMLQWGQKYKDLHVQVWREVWRVLKEDGVFFLNISDHIRKGAIVHVSVWHLMTCMDMGFTLIDQLSIETKRMRFGQNHDVRVEHEMIYVFRKTPVLPLVTETITVRKTK